MSQDRATKGSDLLVAALANEGVDRVFGVPGEKSLDVVESLRQSSTELVLTRPLLLIRSKLSFQS